ncbi:MAG: hypothetical protein O7F74_07315 [Bacteroidetes bacterium]|nr:hypothetical protein [Bacteroidota bacterium]
MESGKPEKIKEQSKTVDVRLFFDFLNRFHGKVGHGIRSGFRHPITQTQEVSKGLGQV